jgi:hypothetical protein
MCAKLISCAAAPLHSALRPGRSCLATPQSHDPFGVLLPLLRISCATAQCARSATQLVAHH